MFLCGWSARLNAHVSERFWNLMVRHTRFLQRSTRIRACVFCQHDFEVHFPSFLSVTGAHTRNISFRIATFYTLLPAMHMNDTHNAYNTHFCAHCTDTYALTTSINTHTCMIFRYATTSERNTPPPFVEVCNLCEGGCVPSGSHVSEYQG